MYCAVPFRNSMLFKWSAIRKLNWTCLAQHSLHSLQANCGREILRFRARFAQDFACGLPQIGASSYR